MTTSAAASGARQTLTAQLLRFVVQLVAIVVLARLLSPEAFGYFGMVAAVTGAAVLLGDFGLSSASMQARHISIQQRSNLFWVNVAIGTLSAGIIVGLAPVLAGFYGQEELVPIIYVLSSVFVVSSLATQFYADAARSLRFRALAVADVLSPIVALVVAVIFALLGAGVWSLVAQQLSMLLTRLIAITAAVRWLPSWPKRAPMRGLLSFGAAAFGVQALNYVSSNIDSVLIGRYVGPQQLGLYDRAYQLFKLPMQQIAAPLTRVALPVMAKAQDDMVALNAYILRSHRVLIFVVGAPLAFMVAASDVVIEVFLGRDWLGAAPVLAILALGGFFQLSGYVYYWAFLATGKTGLQLRYAIATRILMVGLIISGVPFGLLGVSVAVSASLMLNWLTLTLFPIRQIGIKTKQLCIDALDSMTMHVLAAVLVGVSHLLLRGAQLQAIVELIVLVLASLASYTVFIALVPLFRRRFREVLQFIRRSF